MLISAPEFNQGTARRARRELWILSQRVAGWMLHFAVKGCSQTSVNHASSLKQESKRREEPDYWLSDLNENKARSDRTNMLPHVISEVTLSGSIFIFQMHIRISFPFPDSGLTSEVAEYRVGHQQMKVTYYHCARNKSKDVTHRSCGFMSRCCSECWSLFLKRSQCF